MFESKFTVTETKHSTYTGPIVLETIITVELSVSVWSSLFSAWKCTKETFDLRVIKARLEMTNSCMIDFREEWRVRTEKLLWTEIQAEEALYKDKNN